MSTYLGPVGSIIPVKCASRLTSSGGRQVSFEDTLGKRKAFLGQVKARQWSVDIGLAKPQELSGLRWLAENVNSPMVWYGPDAVVGNVLTPAQADLAPGTHNGLEGPLVEVEPGVWVKSVLDDPGSPAQIGFPRRSLDNAYVPVPVVPGRPVTVSAWVRGPNPGLSVTWRDQEGAYLQGDVAPAADPLDVLTRVHRTLVPPAGASQLTLLGRVEQLAGPAVTLTDRLTPYSPGKGATRVVAHGLSESLILVTEQKSISSASFTVSEVG